MTRMASLSKEKEDFVRFRHHRNRIMGNCVSWEYYQPVPYIFTREGAQMNLIGHYKGASAFLICNGPSLVSGRYDLSLLKKPGVITYGVNNGPATVRPDFWTCVDDPKRFLKSIWLDPKICKIVPSAHSEKPIFDNEKWEDLTAIDPQTNKPKKILVGDCPNVLYFHRNSKFVAERFLYEDTINWGNHADYGGGRSVMLPALRLLFLLGFRKVFLLGADFKMSETYTYHFDEQRSKGAVKGNLATYDRLKNEYFPSLKPIFDAEGFEVYNCTEGSELKVFPFVQYEEAIGVCTSPLGDLKNQRTWGLYSKPEERQKWKDEPENVQKAHIDTIKNRVVPEEDVVHNNILTDVKVEPKKPSVEPKPPIFEPKQVVAKEENNNAPTAIPRPPKTLQPLYLGNNSEIVDATNEIFVNREDILKSKPIVQLYPGPEQNIGKVIKKIPCGPIETMGSSKPNVEAPCIENHNRFITLPDNGK